MTWLDADEYDRRYAYHEEMAFQRKTSQGELCAPMVISDTQSALQCMTNGKYYDSKSEMRKEHKRAGVVEVGNEKQSPNRHWADEKAKRAKQRQEIKGALHRAHSRMGFGAA
ncbi:hypothetical protein [uncultured Roseobacter sp.]|uniref:hypothetical protein n=1 Tax=uncultured Roseobacter sp. TaxID=114847 RepID=UPI00261EE0AA|nr:hypothetical protein [uncultured Roseobacter sp.]